MKDFAGTKRRLPYLAGLMGLLLALAFWAGRGTGTHSSAGGGRMAAAPNATAAGKPEKVRLYVCPMNDTPPKTEPGNCPVCGMTLVPMPEDAAGGDNSLPVLALTESARKLSEVEVAPVRRGFAQVDLRLAGKVGYDETRERVISAWVPGRLEKVLVDNTGTLVNKGEPLVEIYSQKLNGEKAIYLSTLKDKPQGGEGPERRKQLNRARLTLLGLTNEQIDELEQRPVMKYTELLLSPISGTVVEKNAKEGMYVNEGEALYKVADLTRVWVWLEAYESDLPFIRFGQEAKITVPAYDNETFSGMVSFVEPVLNDQTRTARVRVQVENSELKLKPNMLVRAVIQTLVGEEGGIVPPERLRGKWVCPRHPEVIRNAPGRCEESGLALLSTEALGYVTRSLPKPALLVPAGAVLLTGKRGYVYRESRSDGQVVFTGVEVELGPRAGADYVIRSGLNEGDLVAVNGAFRIDSALQLTNRPSMMRPAVQQSQVAGGMPVAKPVAAAPAPVVPAAKAVTTAENSMDGMGAMNSTDSMGKPSGKPVAAGGVDSTLAAPGASASGALHSGHGTLPEPFRNQLTEVMKQYLKIQRALGDDDAPRAQQEVGALAQLCVKVDPAGLAPDQLTHWQAAAGRIAELAAAYVKGKDIEEQRTVFVPLSAVMEDLARAAGTLPGLEIYRAFCPMAFGNNGAYWLQDGKLIHNPYEGKRMLKCGSIKEQITGQQPAIHGPADAR